MITVIRIADFGLQLKYLYDELENDRRQRRAHGVSIKISMVSSLLQTATFIGEQMELSNHHLSYVKWLEVVTRMTDMPLKVCKVLDDGLPVCDPYYLSTVHQVIVVPSLSTFRSMNELMIFTDKSYLDSLDNTAKKKGVSTDIQTARKETDARLKKNEETLIKLHAVEVIAKGIDSWVQMQHKFMRELEQENQRLISHLQRLPEQIAQQIQQGVANPQNNEQNHDPCNLVLCDQIPACLEEDEIFSKYVCPITLRPVRDAVGDPTSQNAGGMTICERSAITDWLSNHPTSPNTQQRLSADQLVELPFINELIDERLEMYTDALRKRVRDLLNHPANPQRLARAVQENPRYQ